MRGRAACWGFGSFWLNNPVHVAVVIVVHDIEISLSFPANLCSALIPIQFELSGDAGFSALNNLHLIILVTRRRAKDLVKAVFAEQRPAIRPNLS